jgi:large subunit ribosomal protein L6
MPSAFRTTSSSTCRRKSKLPASLKRPDPRIILEGIDKQLLGQVAPRSAHSAAEPYKGKGVKYSDEIVRRKAG